MRGRKMILKKIISVAVCSIVLSACSYNITRDDGGISKTYTVLSLSESLANSQVDRLYQADLEAHTTARKAEEEKAQEEREEKKCEADEKRKAIEKKRKLKIDFEREIADTSCSKEKWSRYTFGGYYKRLSNEYKITPYETIYGDSYATRNIPQATRWEALENHSKYVVYHFSEAEKEICDNEKDKDKKAALFNKIVEKDYRCYNLLK